MQEKLKEFLGEEWTSTLDDNAFVELEKIFAFLKERKKLANILPDQKNIFRAFKETPISNIRVVVLGQDCYHTYCEGVPVANGLSFSINEEIKDVFFQPPSLRNILTEIENDIYPMTFIPERLALSYKEAWGSRLTQQGVFLLNTALTVEEGNPNCHSKLWEHFTLKVIEQVAGKEDMVIWILMGKEAQKYESLIPSHHRVLKTSHPSPLGAYKEGKDYPAFIGSRIFSTCNILLEEHGKTPIQW